MFLFQGTVDCFVCVWNFLMQYVIARHVDKERKKKDKYAALWLFQTPENGQNPKQTSVIPK